MRRSAGKKPSRMHEGLVGERALVGTAYLNDDKLRAQYAAEIAPRTAAMLRKIFDQHLPHVAPKRVLDLGAGTGIVGDTLRQRYAGVEVVAIDRVAGPGVIGFDLRKAGSPAGVNGRFDVVIAAHLLNELTELQAPARAALVQSWIRQWLAPGGLLLLIEPALKETSRALLQVRDRLVAEGLFIEAPCVWQGPCPALAEPRDWCHDSAPRPSLPRADFSFLAIRERGQPTQDATLLRVVSDLRREKGRSRLFACGIEGRKAYVLQSREVTPANEAFLALDRGALCRIVGVTAAGDGQRLGLASDVRQTS